MTAHASRIAASDDLAAAAARLTGSPDQLAAQLRTLLDQGAPKPTARESADARREREAETAAHERTVAVLRHRLASDFAGARGWIATTAPLSVKEIARRTSPGGNWHKPAREWLGSLFSLSFYRDGRRRACAAVAHLMAEQVDREREAIKLWAAERELAATFPGTPSWQNPGRAVVVVLQPAEAEEVAQVDRETEERAPPTTSDLAVMALGEPAEAMSQNPASAKASDPVGITDMASPAAPVMRPIAPLDLDGAVPADLSGQGPPDWDLVAPGDLLVDEAYQRGISPKSLALIRRIVEGWSWGKFKPPICTRVDGRLHVIDGQHTSIAAATHGGVPLIPVVVVAVPAVADRAAAFVSHATNRLQATQVQIHRAALTAGDDEAVRLDAVCRAAGVELLPFPPSGTVPYQPRQTVAVVGIRRLIAKRGAERATEILACLAAAELAPISGDLVRLGETLLCDDAYAGGFDAEGLAAALRGLTAKTHAEARELAIAQRLPPWRALAAVLYRNHTRPSVGRRRATA